MCSIGEDDFGDDGGVHGMIPNLEKVTASTNDEFGDCKKCGAENVRLYKLFFRNHECRECFLANARHKFRATLGSSKVLPRDANVLLVFDGSGEAAVLLDMLYHAQTQKTFKRLHCSVRVLHIDETALNGENDKAAHYVQEIQDYLKVYSAFQSYITPIGQLRDIKAFELLDIQNYLERDKPTEKTFVENFKAIRSLTSRQDYLKYHRNNIIETSAAQLDCPYVFMPENSTTLASQLLTAITLGRGGSAAYDVALVDERFTDKVKVIRPLRDLNQSEINLYLEVQHLNPLKSKKENYGISCGAAASLQNLTCAFVENLQENYSSTVSTIFRSCDKIAPKNQLRKDMSSLSLNSIDSNRSSLLDLDICKFCKSPLESTQTNTLLAIEISRLVSEKGTTEEQCTELDKVARQNLIRSNDTKLLCHACNNIEKDCPENFLDIKT